MHGLEENGPKYNDQIKFLLEIYFQCHNDQLKKLIEVVDWLEDEVLTMESKTDRLKTLPTINKYVKKIKINLLFYMFLFVSRMNFKCFIKVILDSLLSSVKGGLKTSESELDRLVVWQSTVYVMEKIVQSIKKQDSRNNLLIFVKVMFYFI